MKVNEHNGCNPPFHLAGITIAFSTLLGLMAVSMHPGVANFQTVPAIMSQIAAYGMHDNFIHGFLILLLAAIASGFSVFGDLLGAHRSAVRFGKIAYLFGYAAMVSAMLFDGFVVPMIGKKFVNANAVDMQTAYIVLQAIGAFIQVLTKAGIIAMSLAFIGWSYALHSSSVMNKWTGKFALTGYVAGIISVCIILFVDVWLGPSNLVIIFAVHAIWNFYVAAILLHATKPID